MKKLATIVNMLVFTIYPYQGVYSSETDFNRCASEHFNEKPSMNQSELVNISKDQIDEYDDFLSDSDIHLSEINSFIEKSNKIYNTLTTINYIELIELIVNTITAADEIRKWFK